MKALRHSRARVRIVFVLALIAQLPGCGGDGPSEPRSPTVAQVDVTPEDDTLTALGATRQFSAVARDAEGNAVSGVTFAWSSSDQAVATVGAGSGLASAAGEGTALITAAVGGVTGSAALVVIQEVAGVEVTPASAELTSVGATQQFGAVARDAGGSQVAGVKLLWVSSNPSVATVDTLGLATARAAGEVTITAAARGVPGHAVLAVTPRGFATVSAGGVQSCGMTLDGRAYCWGGNPSGQLGDGTSTNRLTPVPVVGGLTFTAVSAGLLHTCGTATTGAVHCWGLNSQGQLGDGTTTDRLTPVPVSEAPVFPVMDAGSFHTCGVAVDETVFCWGDNGFGQLGDGTTIDRSTPVDVGGPFASVSGGAGHTCGVLTGTGEAYCWGFNLEGEVGDGSTTNRSIPTLVAGGLAFASVSAGSSHTCGVTTAGTAHCWGSNAAGQLGDRTTAQRLTPVPVAGGLTFAAISAGTGHTCGVTTGGVAYCWGGNLAGQLGDGSFARREVPAAVAGHLTFAAVSAGQEHTCGVTTSGAAYCWGSNVAGKLGDGTLGSSAVPVRVAF